MNLESVLLPIMGLLIPIITILAGLSIALMALKHRAKRNELEHQERMLALERGAPLPPAMVPPPRTKNPYLWGFILVAFGLALSIGLATEGDSEWVWGGLFFFVGIGILLANWLHKRELHAKREGESERLPQGEAGGSDDQRSDLGSA